MYDDVGIDRKLLKLLLISMLIISSIGTVYADKDVKITPEIKYTNNLLGGYIEPLPEGIYVFSSTIQLFDSVVNGTEYKKFDDGSNISIVIFRGNFHHGGYGIVVDSVKIKKHKIKVKVSYKNPPSICCWATVFTQPATIISLGKLNEGKYKVEVKITEQVCTSSKFDFACEISKRKVKRKVKILEAEDED